MLEELNKHIKEAERLSKILEERPEILEYVKLVENGKATCDIGESLLSVAECAKRLKVNRNTVYRYIDEGLLEGCYTPAPSRLKVRVSDLNKFIRNLPNTRQ